MQLFLFLFFFEWRNFWFIDIERFVFLTTDEENFSCQRRFCFLVAAYRHGNNGFDWIGNHISSGSIQIHTYDPYIVLLHNDIKNGEAHREARPKRKRESTDKGMVGLYPSSSC